MIMKFIGALGGIVFLVAEASAGGMPPAAEIDANGVPVDIVESTETVTTAAVDEMPMENLASPPAIQRVTAMSEAQPGTGKDHR